MIRSMTGYGAARHESEALLIKVEMKSLNGKYNEVNLRVPRILSSQETIIRSQVSQWTQRGTLQVNIQFQRRNIPVAQKLINDSLLQAYIAELKGVAEKTDLNANHFLGSLLNIPDMLSVVETDLTEDEIQKVHQTLSEAFHQLDQFRLTEGESISHTFEKSIQQIRKLLIEVEPFDQERNARVRQRILDNLQQNIPDEKWDPARFEAEMIYYIEKMDISEEKTRLKQHLDYFIITMKDSFSGKKLGFIAQEIGREINTLGSKANDFDIQQKVVQMKDELEKIREQVLNVV